MAYFAISELADIFPEDRIVNELVLDDEELYAAEITLLELQDGVFAAGSVEAKVQRRLSQAVKAAEAKANGILAAKLTVPVAPPTDDLLLAVKQIAIRLLYQRKPETEDGYKREYDEAVEALEAIRDGDNQVPGAATAVMVITAHDAAESAPSAGFFINGGLNEF